MRIFKNAKFWDAVQGARNVETEIVRGCTARLRVPRNDVMHPKDEFVKVLKCL